MHPRTHFLAGLRLVLHSPSLLAWVYFTTLVVALPLTLGMKHLLQGSFEGSLVEDNLRQASTWPGTRRLPQAVPDWARPLGPGWSGSFPC